MVLPHPSGCERKQGQPEKQVQVGPKNTTANAMNGIEHVVVVVPVNADIHITQQIAEKDRQYRFERRQFIGVRALGNLHLQDHNGNDDSDDAVAEGFHAVLAHATDIAQPVQAVSHRASRRRLTKRPGSVAGPAKREAASAAASAASSR